MLKKSVLLLAVLLLTSTASADLVIPYRGMGNAPTNGAPSYYFGTDLNQGFFVTIASPISAPEPLTFTGLSGYFVGLRDDIVAGDVLGWFRTWEDLPAFGAGASPVLAEALNPTRWTLMSTVFDDQGLFVYEGHWDLPGMGQLPLGSGLAGGTVWGASPNDLFGVLSNPTVGLDPSVYTDDLTVPGYTGLDAIDAVGVPAWNTEFNGAAVPEPSSFLMLFGLFGTSGLLRWWYCWRRGIPFLPTA